MEASSRTASAASRALVALQTQELRRNLQTPIPAPRIDLERKISLRFPHFQGFLTEYSSNISITGMFIQSNDPQPPGTILDFEFNLIDGLKLIRGTGEVIWVRLVDEGPELPTGMGLRFLRLDAESRRLIRWAVEKQIDEGTELFELKRRPAEDRFPEQVRPPAAPDDAPSAGELAPPPVEKIDTDRLYPFAGYAAARRTSHGGVKAAAAVTVTTALLAWGSYVSLSRPDAAPLSAVSAPARAAEIPASTPNAAPVAAPGSPAIREQLIGATESWARAWSEQRADDYLGFYSERFQPPGSVTRAEWEALRRDRITRPRFIQVGIGGLEVELTTPVLARVTFDQSYRSDSYRDAVRKTLELVREDGRWKILDERAAG